MTIPWFHLFWISKIYNGGGGGGGGGCDWSTGRGGRASCRHFLQASPWMEQLPTHLELTFRSIASSSLHNALMQSWKMAQGHWAFGHSAFGHWALGHVEIHVQMLNVLMLNVPMLNVPESSMQHKVTRKKEQTFPLCCNFSKICVSWQNVCFLGKTPLVAKCRL